MQFSSLYLHYVILEHFVTPKEISILIMAITLILRNPTAIWRVPVLHTTSYSYIYLSFTFAVLVGVVGILQLLFAFLYD